MWSLEVGNLRVNHTHLVENIIKKSDTSALGLDYFHYVLTNYQQFALALTF